MERFNIWIDPVVVWVSSKGQERRAIYHVCIDGYREHRRVRSDCPASSCIWGKMRTGRYKRIHNCDR